MSRLLGGVGCLSKHYGALHGGSGCLRDCYVRDLKKFFYSSCCQYQNDSLDCNARFLVYFN